MSVCIYNISIISFICATLLSPPATHSFCCTLLSHFHSCFSLLLVSMFPGLTHRSYMFLHCQFNIWYIILYILAQLISIWFILSFYFCGFLFSSDCNKCIWIDLTSRESSLFLMLPIYLQSHMLSRETEERVSSLGWYVFRYYVHFWLS